METATTSGLRTDDSVKVVLEGRITAYTAAPIWQDALDTLARNPDRPIVVDASRLEYVDDVGIALLFDLLRRDRPPQAKVEIRDLASNLAALVEAYDPKDFAQPPPGRPPIGILEHVGRVAAQEVAYVKTIAGFFGAMRRRALARAHAIAAWSAGARCSSVATEAGANAVPIVLLIGFLMGVIIAFEIGLVAQQFGAVIFVVNGVGIAMLRELGALMTAIVFAGRTGAAFAAQIGTQKVNEEVNAITDLRARPGPLPGPAAAARGDARDAAAHGARRHRSGFSAARW